MSSSKCHNKLFKEKKIVMDYLELYNGIKIPNKAYGTYLIDKSEFGCINCVKTAIKSGIKHIDGAYIYGNQELVGEAIKQCIEEGIIERGNLFITSKVPENQYGYLNTKRIVQNSLKTMNLDYFDMFLLHSPYRTSKEWKRWIEDSWCALEELYEAKVLKSIGVSNFNIKHLEYLLSIAKIKPMINQVEIHPQHQQKELVKFCKNNNIAISCWGALNQGRIFKNETFLKLANKYNKDASQIAIKWSLNKGFIPIVTSSKEERIKNFYKIDDFELTNEDMRLLDNLDGGEFSNWHTENEKPIEMIDPSKLVEYIKSINTTLNSTYICKLFGIFPFLKIKIYGDYKKKFSIFGIPILKIAKKRTN